MRFAIAIFVVLALGAADLISRAEREVSEGIADLRAGGTRADAWVTLQTFRIEAWCAQAWSGTNAAPYCVATQSAALATYIDRSERISADRAVACQIANIPRWTAVLSCLTE